MRQLFVGDVDEKSMFLQKYFAEQIEPYAKLLDECPDKVVFNIRPYLKRATGWPANPTVDVDKFPLLSCLNEFVVIPDLKSMGEICGDGGVTNQYPLGSVAVEKHQFGESLLVILDKCTDLPGFVNDGITAYNPAIAKNNQLLSICYFRTPEEVDALWNDLEEKARTIIDNDPEKYGNLSYEQLRDSDDPELSTVYKALRKKLLARMKKAMSLCVTSHLHMLSEGFEIGACMLTTILQKGFLFSLCAWLFK